MALHQLGQAAFQLPDLVAELPDAPGQETQGDVGGVEHRTLAGLMVQAVVDEPCAGAEQLCLAQLGQFLSQLRIATDEDGFELVDRLGAGLDRGVLGQFVHPGDLHRPGPRQR
ncbi:hypothetical protein [Streptomyces flaveolus]|uniref:hypothetical protein n=1 Tax=Streptomyces flaveolus TaxID=67297 RepID=UPI0036F8015B